MVRSRSGMIPMSIARKDFNSFQDILLIGIILLDHMRVLVGDIIIWRLQKKVFWRKLPEEYLFGMGDRLFGW